MNLSFEDLIGKQYLSTYNLDLPGVGVVEISQLSAAEAAKIVADMDDLSGPELEDFICLKAAEFLKGSKPTKDEVDRLKENLTAKTISKVFKSGLESSDSSLEDLEEAEKK